jgi:diamine N-acetyltransferase
VTSKNWRAVIELSVKKEQANFIESNLFSLAQARVEPYWQPVALYVERELIGFAMYGLVPGEGIWLDRFMIDLRFQGQGLGKRMLVALLQLIKTKYGCQRIYSSLFSHNHVMWRLLNGLGFKATMLKDTRGEQIVYLELRKLGKGVN